MTRMFVAALTLTALLGAPLSAQQTEPERSAWRTVAAALPPGASVEIRLKDSRRFRGTLVELRSETVLFKPRTRIPVPASEIAFSDIDSLEARTPGMSPGAKVLIGVGSGVGGFMLLVLAMLAGSSS